MDLIPHRGATAAAVLAIPGGVADAEKGRAERKERVAVSGSGRDAVRIDLDAVFRRDYHLVVGVAARVLGSRGGGDAGCHIPTPDGAVVP